jgi:hypothetical protein
MTDKTSLAASGGEADRLGVLRERLVDRGMDGQELRQAGNLNHGVSLLGKPGEREALPRASTVHKELDQSADSGGIKKRDAAHIEDEVRGRFGAKGLNEIVNGFDAQLASEPSDEAIGIRARQLFQVKPYSLHKLRRVTQNGCWNC